MEKESIQNSVTDEDSKDLEPPTPQSDEITMEITQGDFLDFIDKETDKYLKKFGWFCADGRDKFTFTWNWSAFFFTCTWMAYRKLYGWALVVFLLNFVHGLSILLLPVLGFTGNYLYYKHAKKKILKLKATQTFSDSTQMSNALRKTGGGELVGSIYCFGLWVCFGGTFF